MYIRLRGKLYSNDSNILVSEIGERDNGQPLLCFTDLIQCCKSNDKKALGEWFYPNGSVVGLINTNEEFYKNRGPSRVRLHRRENVTSPIGHFCCQIPDATLTNITVCVNIGELTTALNNDAVTFILQCWRILPPHLQ